MNVISNLVPILLMIATGWAAQTRGLIAATQWVGIERITYYFFFPAVVLETLATADLSRVPVFGLSVALIGALALVMMLLLVLRAPLAALFSIDGPAFTSLFQGSTRWNTFIGLALAASIYGREGLTLLAFAIAAMVPFLNVSATLVLARWGTQAHASPGALARALATNPYIVSTILGVLINAARLPIPAEALSYFHILGSAALPCGLLVVGAGLDLNRLRRPSAAIAISSVLKLFVLPALVAAIGRIAGLDGVPLAIAVIASAMPTASGAYVLARQLGGDAPLMAEILTVQTVLAAITMPAAVVMFGG